MKEVNKEIKGEPAEIVYKPWNKGVKDLPNVVYFRAVSGESVNCGYTKIILVAVDYKGELLGNSRIVGINNENKLFLFGEINNQLGLELNENDKIKMAVF